MTIQRSMTDLDVDISAFLKSGLEIRSHLARYLGVSLSEVERRLSRGSEELAELHPGSSASEDVDCFYEDTVGTAHLVELAAWHLGSADYIADTLRLQQRFAKGQLLDFGGGIGTHALAAAALSEVDHVWFVDLNPHNRAFVEYRAELLGLDQRISVHRDLECTGTVSFDTVICLDVLEHVPDPSMQLLEFHKRMNSDSTALFNWYFFKGFNGEYPFHFDDPSLVEGFFKTLQMNFLEVFHPFLITTRAYRLI